MIGRCHAARGQNLQVGARQEFLHIGPGTQIHDRHGCAAISQKVLAGIANDAPQDRQYIGCLGRGGRTGFGGIGCLDRGATFFLQPLLDQRRVLDDPVIGHPCIIGKGEMTVLQQQ